MSRILLAESSPTVRKSVRDLLTSACHEVLEAADGREALRAHALQGPELVLLDRALPGVDGYDVCRRIRARDAVTPVLMLSAWADETEKVLGLRLGADDYVVRPFGRHELLARIDALLRRARVQETGRVDAHAVFNLGENVVDGRALSLTDAQGRRTRISQREHALLRYFAAHPGEIARRRDLFTYAWGAHVSVFSRTLDTHISALRRKISSLGCRLEAVSGVGYRLLLAH